MTQDRSPSEQEGQYYPAVSDDEDIASSLRSLVLMVRRRIKLILLVTALGTGAAGYVAYSRAPTYTGQTLVMLTPDNHVVDMEAVAAGLGSDVTAVETQVKLLSSPVYLAKLAQQLPGSAGADDKNPSAQGALATLAAMLPKDWLIASGFADEKPELDPEAEAALKLDRQVDRLAGNLKVRQEGRSLVISINYSSKDPTQAAAVANKLADFYIEDQIAQKSSVTRQASDQLGERLAELKSELEKSEQEAQAYRSAHKLFEGKGLGIDNQQVSDLTNMLVDTRAKRSEKETRLRYIRDLQARGERLESITEVLQSPFLANLWQQQSLLAQQEADLLSTFGDKHPKVLILQAQKKDIADKIDRELKRIVDNMQNEISVLGARERSIQADIGELMKQKGVSGQAEVQMNQLERQAEANRKLYEEFLQRFKETQQQQDIVQANARVIAHAKAPNEPSSLPPGLILLAGFMASSMMGVGLSWLTERLDNGLRSGKQIEGEFGVPCLGLVPFLRSAGKGFDKRPHRYLLAKPLSAYAETIRSVHTALRLGHIDQPPKVIQVTSSVPGEGKTVFAVSLATLLAQTGHRVLLLDLDLRHPSVQREIRLPQEADIAGYAMGEAELRDLIHHDADTGLDVIAVRRPPQNPAAILASQRIRDLLLRLRAEYDYIVLDSTPVLGVSDSKVATELADAVLFVVRWEQTTRDIAHDALKELLELKIKVSGAVLTQVDLTRHARYGYGGIDNYYNKYTKYYQN